jgi:lipoic acid synthetase
MILGDKCTRACGFCNVTTGKPTEYDVLEPFRAAQAIKTMGLSHAVITSVNRDDLADGGAEIFAATIRETRRIHPDCEIEVLIPDLKGDEEALGVILTARPEVLNHNTETVLRLQREIRTSASYGRSLALLARAKASGLIVKSGLIVGMGETEREVLGALSDLRAIGVDIVTIGQYLGPLRTTAPFIATSTPTSLTATRASGRKLAYLMSRLVPWCAPRITLRHRDEPSVPRRASADGYQSVWR